MKIGGGGKRGQIVKVRTICPAIGKQHQCTTVRCALFCSGCIVGKQEPVSRPQSAASQYEAGVIRALSPRLTCLLILTIVNY